eukprot:5781597-Pyramimonas_sp.AAC.1
MGHGIGTGGDGDTFGVTSAVEAALAMALVNGWMPGWAATMGHPTDAAAPEQPSPVSYTHLTLPTILLV